MDLDLSENKRLVLWERGRTADLDTGKPVGVLLNPDEIFEGVSTFEFNFVLFPGIPGNRVVELPESFPDEDGFDIPLERMFVDELIPISRRYWVRPSMCPMTLLGLRMS